MLLEQFAIPSALFLSIIALRIRYSRNHYIAILFCLGGLACSLINDIIITPQSGSSEGLTLKAFYGDLMVIGGAFLYATY